MATRLIALSIGLFYIAFGVCGFVPSLVYPTPDRVDFVFSGIAAGYGMLFGFLPTNVVHNVLYLVIGAGGVVAAMSWSLAAAYCRGLFFFMVMLVFLGILPQPLNRVFGLVPLFDWNNFIHLVTGVLAWYSGMIYPLGRAKIVGSLG